MDAFASIGAAEVLASSTLGGYIWSGYRYSFPLARTWMNVTVVLVSSLVGSFLVMALEGHSATLQHIAGHIVIGILAAATIGGLRGVHSITEQRRDEKRNGLERE